MATHETDVLQPCPKVVSEAAELFDRMLQEHRYADGWEDGSETIEHADGTYVRSFGKWTVTRCRVPLEQFEVTIASPELLDEGGVRIHFTFGGPENGGIPTWTLSGGPASRKPRGQLEKLAHVHSTTDDNAVVQEWFELMFKYLEEKAGK